MSNMALYWIEPDSPPDNFPDIQYALKQPDGLLCFGGDLSQERLLAAYRRGIFPWYSDDQPIMWWSPNPRCVLLPDDFKLSRSLRKSIRNAGYTYSFDQTFEQVIQACSEPRDDEAGTWITSDMKQAYIALHKAGHVHSVEIWSGKQLIGGLYGIAIGQIFFGESMFSRQRDTSKIALYALSQRLFAHRFKLIDCQVSSAHLYTLGAGDISRKQFGKILAQRCDLANSIEIWQHEPMPTQTLLHHE